MIDAADFLKWLEVFNVQFGSSTIPIPVPISMGGTGVTSVTVAPTASMWAGWDANKNLSANNFILGYATTPTAATTTTLTVSSAYLQFFTGSTTQNVVMPVVSTLVLGQPYKIVNNSSGSVTVKSSGGNTIQVMLANTSLLLTCVAITGTTETSWDSEYFIDSALALPLSLASGGTNANLTANAGGVVWSDSTKFNILDGTLTPNQILMSGITDAPAWSTASYPPTTTINRILFSSANNVVSEISTVVSAGLLTDGSGVPAWVTATGTGAPVLGTAPTISAPKIDQINDQANNLKVVTFSGVPSAVNYIDISSSATGISPQLTWLGTDSNINAVIAAKGTGSFVALSNGANVFIASNTSSSAVNYISVSGVVTGSNPAIAGVGADSNISVNATGKGTGRFAIQGISTNTAAAAGYVGEFITSNVPLSSAVSLSNSTSTDVTSISLTAGDWDVSGSVSIAYGTNGQIAEMWISSTSATPPDPSVKGGQLNLSLSNITAYVASSPSQRFLLSTTTTIYLSCYSTFTGTATACGSIYARRRS